MTNAADTIVRCLEEVFRSKGLEPPVMSAETQLSPELGLDSLDYAELVIRLESAFGFDPFAEGPAPEIRKVKDMATLYASFDDSDSQSS